MVGIIVVFFHELPTMSRVSLPIKVSDEELKELKRLANGKNPVMSLRAKIILNGLDGTMNKDVAAQLGIEKRSVSHWKESFRKYRIEGLRKTYGGGVKKSDDEIAEAVAKVKNAVSADDKWTIESLAASLGMSGYLVKKALNQLGISHRRIHVWRRETEDPLIVKSLEVTGVYLSSAVRAIVVTSSPNPLGTRKGELCTRNRRLYQELEKSANALTFPDILVAAAAHSNDMKTGKTVSLAEFLTEIHRELPEFSESHVFLFGDKPPLIRINRPVVYHYHEFSDSKEWLGQFRAWVTGTYATEDFDQIDKLTAAIGVYLDSVKETTEPFFWRKFCGQRTDAATRDNSAPPEVTESVEKLMKSMNEDSSQMKVGAVLVLQDGDDTYVSALKSETPFPASDDFDFSSPETIGRSLGRLEKPVYSFTHSMDKKLLEMLCETVKKNTP